MNKWIHQTGKYWIKGTLFILMNLFLLSPQTNAQGWEQIYPDYYSNQTSLFELSGGEYLFMNRRNQSETYVVKTDSVGLIIAQHVRTDTNPRYRYMNNATLTSTEDIVMTGFSTLLGPSPYTAWVSKVDTGGNTIWETSIQVDGLVYYDITTGAGGDIFTVGDTNGVTFISKLDAQGNHLWSNSYTFPGIESVTMDEIEYGTNQEVVFSGSGFDFNGNFELVYGAIDSSGALLWSKTHRVQWVQVKTSLVQTTDGGWGIATSTSHNGYSAMFVMKVDSAGNMIWADSTNARNTDSYYMQDLVATPDSGLVVLGEWIDQTTGNPNRQAVLIRYSGSGQYLWEHDYGDTGGDSGHNVVQAQDGGFTVLGRFGPTAGQSTLSGWLFHTDSLGIYVPKYVTGSLFLDTNGNCMWDSGESPAANLLVEAQPSGRMGLTDTAGAYKIRLNTGTYAINPVLNPNYLNSACYPAPTGRSVNLVGTNLVSGQDFPLDPLFSCPVPRVSMVPQRIRWCDVPNPYIISYTNWGGVAADSTVITLEFDPGTIVDSASIPWRTPQTGNIYEFDVDTLLPYIYDQFWVWTHLNCSTTVMGQTHCAKAWIYPDTCYEAAPNWSGADLIAENRCIGDSLVELEITNVGTGNMMTPIGVMVIEDNIIRAQQNVTLNAQDVWTYPIPANGSTWSLITRQPPGHPFPGSLVTFAEGCGVDVNGDISLGFAPFLPWTNSNPFFYEDCRASTGSYDPNDKRATPAGWGPGHLIDTATTTLEYQIRFQNTGTDTAFKVVILDTLVSELDIRTFQAGVASHPYTLAIDGRELAFTFDPISLPDSNTNVVASQGFVNFSIDLVPGLPIGTRIENRAAIYFDRNAPVLTEPAWQEIGTEIFGPVSIAPGVIEMVAVTVYPNPQAKGESVILEWDGQVAGKAQIDIYSNLGTQVFSQPTSLKKGLNRWDLPVNNLPAGLYRVVISLENGSSILRNLVIQ